MEATCSSEKLVNFHWTMWRYITEEKIFVITTMGTYESDIIIEQKLR
jgi:hypothetical protein